MICVLLVLLVLPSWGQSFPMPEEPGGADYITCAAGSTTEVDTTYWDTEAWAAAEKTYGYEWVTVKVDSANLGQRDCWRTGVDYDLHDPAVDILVAHVWVNGPGTSKAGSDYPYEPPETEMLSPRLNYDADYRFPGDHIRERICRVCLRHEWQERRKVPPPKSEFERLKERLK